MSLKTLFERPKTLLDEEHAKRIHEEATEQYPFIGKEERIGEVARVKALAPLQQEVMPVATTIERHLFVFNIYANGGPYYTSDLVFTTAGYVNRLLVSTGYCNSNNSFQGLLGINLTDRPLWKNVYSIPVSGGPLASNAGDTTQSNLVLDADIYVPVMIEPVLIQLPRNRYTMRVNAFGTGGANYPAFVSLLLWNDTGEPI